MIRVLVIALVLFSSCAGGVPRVEKPDNVISREKMVPLLTDLVKLEAHVTIEFHDITKYYKVMTNTGDSLLKSKGYTKDQFESSLDYYGSRQDEMISIYNDVLDRLNRELGMIEVEEKKRQQEEKANKIKKDTLL